MALNFLLVNDDGIDSGGLHTLLDCVRGLGQVITVAPMEHLSGCGHQVTSRVPIKVIPRESIAQHEIRRWAVLGTPVDCVRLGVKALAPEYGLQIDWVLSGINAGGNLGGDIYTSGTVTASREAVILGIPSLALSHHINGRPIDWELAKNRVLPIIKKMIAHPQKKGIYCNINLPQTLNSKLNLEAVHCPVDTNPIQIEFSPNGDNSYFNKGVYQLRPRTPGSDVSSCFEGKISISELFL